MRITVLVVDEGKSGLEQVMNEACLNNRNVISLDVAEQTSGSNIFPKDLAEDVALYQSGNRRTLRCAIQAFRREEELHSSRASKRRRERFEQDKSSSGDLSMQLSRGKGVQFPFAVTDRVIIKGNKRTPLRFVGREAVVTTQCLNGWYVVKTLDNAESVKLQYRSLARVSDSPASNMLSSKAIPNWL
ncbi:U-box domain-containing protein [Thalictrum thalictroides]|uniref:U-box domain-containing protein n=1 Tax=Thalictrum thalictroides TaxID=46969 RepID=A0A7J6XEJ3_THATH|nr:U-box domain-containing protein [Thalictrum thalictroides]